MNKLGKIQDDFLIYPVAHALVFPVEYTEAIRVFTEAQLKPDLNIILASYAAFLTFLCNQSQEKVLYEN